jgi:hypothetical protein
MFEDIPNKNQKKTPVKQGFLNFVDNFLVAAHSTSCIYARCRCAIAVISNISIACLSPSS